MAHCSDANRVPVRAVSPSGPADPLLLALPFLPGRATVCHGAEREHVAVS